MALTIIELSYIPSVIRQNFFAISIMKEYVCHL